MKATVLAESSGFAISFSCFLMFQPFKVRSHSFSPYFLFLNISLLLQLMKGTVLAETPLFFHQVLYTIPISTDVGLAGVTLVASFNIFYLSYIFANILIRRKESNTNLATVSRHRWSLWIMIFHLFS